jgi:hypothetical protein
MKVYLLFCGDNYYPARFSDYKGSFKDYDSAYNFVLEECKRFNEGDNYCEYDWVQILEVDEDGAKLVLSDSVTSLIEDEE